MPSRKTLDPLSYINSKDIRVYLEGINYQFNTVETAWLIYQCKNLTIPEKHDAWKTLMKSNTDVDMSAYKSFGLEMSLFEYITKYIRLEKKIFSKFKKEDTNCVYFHGGAIERNGQKHYSFDFIPYSTLDKSISSMFELYNDGCDPNDILYLNITKSYIDNLGEITATMDLDKNILSISKYDVPDKDEDLINKGFATLYLDFPLPFKYGDLVWDEYEEITQALPVAFCEKSPELSPAEYVILGHDYNETVLKVRCYQEARPHGFLPCGFYNYMNLTYYTGSMEDRKALAFLSDYMHGELGEKDYKKFCMKALTNDALDFHSYKIMPEEIEKLHRHVQKIEVDF